MTQPGKPFAWLPTKEEKGFRPAPLTREGRLVEVSKAYNEAGAAILRAIEGSGDSFGAFPMVFLYRHAIEAHIKGILLEFGSEIGISDSDVRERGHDLCEQLPDLLRVSRLVGSETSRVTESAINQINGFDPGATKFRYAQDEMKEFDVKHFANEANSVLEELMDLYSALQSRALKEAVAG